MKIIILGLLAFTAWSVPSTYYYVCNIKMLCPEEEEASIVPKPEPKEDVVSIAPEPAPEPEEEEPMEQPETYVVHHDFDQAAFDPANSFQSYVDQINNYISANSEAKIVITGNTDSKGGDSYNYELGMERAEFVRKEIIKRGVEQSSIETRSLGETSPVTDNESKSGRAQNRRTEIAIQIKK